ncbi:metallophosphoesterase [Mesorhizobium sp. IMUNJ 23232]|uniref:metallophosphoesterase n=1 Tax=Mesorhizobium sp. IMUNJ 23232 TaxID=3376064 RepID=UPI003795FB7C
MATDDTTSSEDSLVRWLHLSDLHVGVRYQNQLWPRFKTIFLKDLDDLLRRTGKIDLLIFSGDLAQQGKKEEFSQFDEVLDEILDRISRSQDAPMVITVPGNHDLVRPSNLKPESVALKQFWSNPELRAGFWDNEGDSYRSFLSGVFANYSEWRDRAIEKKIHVPPTRNGLLPGDSSYLVTTKSGKIGVVGLNSTWLQLTQGNYQGELHVDARQILNVTEDRPDEWVGANQVNLLVTHQPANWLHSNRPSTWENDVNPPGRFDAHLFGHMHQPDTLTLKHAGSPNRLSMQAASLFGLERTGDGEFERIQGYSVNEIRMKLCKRTLISWPRRRITTTSGRDKLDRDAEQDLDEESGSFSVTYEIEKTATLGVTVESYTTSTSTDLELGQLPPFDLTATLFATGEARAHRNVRRVEQETCLHALSKARIVWISADWGMGLDGFVSSIRDKIGVQAECVFSLDFSEFRERKSFFDALQTRLNASFQQICEAIANVGPTILILDDIDLAAHPELQPDIEALASTIADFASQTRVIIRSRRRPRVTAYQIVELRALEEPDVATYASESEIGGSRYGKPDAASKLFRHTDGVPTRIDDALRDLEIVSLEDLIASNPDFGATGNALAGAPQALVTSVRELQQSQDRAEQRAYELLLALAALPQGEQLTRLKRFLGVHPLGPIHARALLEKSLIDTVGLTALDVNTDSTDKALVVPRPVRDFVRETMSDEVASSTDRKAINLYFGEDWTSGSIRNSPTGKRVREAFCPGYEIQNSCTLILRVTRRSLDSGITADIESAIRLALAFVDALADGDHFRAVVSLCEDMVHLISDHSKYDKELTKFNYEYARSLRMTGSAQEARDVLLKLDETKLDRSDRQQAALSLAMCYDSLGDEKNAVDAAKHTISINRHSNAALHGKVIIAEQIEDEAERESELRKLLRQSVQKKAHTLTNNIRLELARNGALRGENTYEALKEITKDARTSGDYYNSARAIIDLANLSGAESTLTGEEKTRLIEAYHFLYNERLFDLFDKCHEALWRVFERAGDRANLLNLFRRSSFIWRLNGREHKEMKYLASLRKVVRDLIAAGITQANRDGAYFIVRVTVVTGTALNDLLLDKSSSVAK